MQVLCHPQLEQGETARTTAQSSTRSWIGGNSLNKSGRIQRPTGQGRLCRTWFRLLSSLTGPLTMRTESNLCQVTAQMKQLAVTQVPLTRSPPRVATDLARSGNFCVTWALYPFIIIIIEHSVY